MALALFDLDNTLLDGDSDYLWGRFLVEQKIVDGGWYEQENQRFFEDYHRGSLDIQAYLRFQGSILARHDLATLQAWREMFLQNSIKPIVLARGRECMDAHRRNGDLVVIVTATNRFITAPVARLLQVDHLLATDMEIVEGRFSGQAAGVPCFQAGKIYHLRQWIQQTGDTLTGSWFYSDSHNDLPLLQQVDHPVAVDPDERLRDYAAAHGWKITSFRG
ncbi:MAG: HAD family hydrolase [Magnetococcales bacterium]|nr:HAD family hydrolase [Magnetococcales bacterium]